MMSASANMDRLEAVLLEDHVRLMDEACVTLSEAELRSLIVEIAQEVESYYQFKSALDTESTQHFNLTEFVSTSMAQSRRPV